MRDCLIRVITAMSALRRSRRGWWRSSSGSGLIAVLALTVLIALGGVGYLAVISTGVNNEHRAMQLDAARQAAESGVLAGLNWLRNVPTFPTAGQELTPFSSLQIDATKEIYVRVDVKALTGSTVEVSGTAFSTSQADEQGASTFLKRIKVTAIAGSFGRYGTFFHRLHPSEVGGGWQGFYGGKLYHGRFHWNDPNNRLELDNNVAQNDPSKMVRFFGDVTVANTRQSTWNGVNPPNPIGPREGNSYNTGLQFHDGPNPSAGQYADKIFKAGYEGSADAVAIPTFATGSISGAFALPRDMKVGADPAYRGYRPLLKFTGENVEYTYYPAAAGPQTTETYAINNMVFECSTAVNVKGKVEGRTTVTAPFGDIAIVGNLYYDSFVAGGENNGIPTSSQDVIGLVSGRDIVFPPQWKDEAGGANLNLERGGILPDRGRKVLLVTANMLAVNPSGMLAATKYGYEDWRLAEVYNYFLTFVGSHTANYYTAISSNNRGGYKSRYYYDSRLDEGLFPPGFQPIRADVSGRWLLSYKNWREESSY